ncbi:hypothetical protein [Leucobacter luti]|uniref:hypothetical protein n=1 Tax=Leucobacter luti TaxID=340320 RepID=UPI00215D9124|nr:hypothetical protein [Leucobacter luti]
MSAMLQVSADRLQQLRSDARLERDTILERRVRGGEDPAIAVEEAPEVDDFVVLALRDELLEDSGRLAEFGLARLAARAGGRKRRHTAATRTAWSSSCCESSRRLSPS